MFNYSDTIAAIALLHQPITWRHCFDRKLAIPHTMMAQAEGNRWEYD